MCHASSIVIQLVQTICALKIQHPHGLVGLYDDQLMKKVKATFNPYL
jgi:hypothetical protein